MESVATPETVWVGFMDVVPVTGKLKEAVEWVLALYEGNQEVVKEKEKSIEKFLTQILESEMEMSMETPPTSLAESENRATAAEASASGSAGLSFVTEVKIEELLEYVREVPGGRKGVKGSQVEERAERAETPKKVKKIKKEILEKIHLIKPNYMMVMELCTEMKSKRKEHVFSNDMLTFHSKVLEKFIGTLKYPSHFRPQLYLLDEQTLQGCPIKCKLHDMVVDFDETEFCVNANAILYGIYSKQLCDAYLHMLEDLRSEDPNRAEQVNTIIELMNKYEIYVDQLAKAKWINNDQDNHIQFNRVKDSVVHMYKNERGVRWCEEVKEVIREAYLESFRSFLE